MQTIEVAEKRYELASLWERWFGQFLDGVIYFVIIVVSLILLMFAGLAEIGVAIAIILALTLLLVSRWVEKWAKLWQKNCENKSD